MSDEKVLKELDLTEMSNEIKALKDALLGSEEAAKALEGKKDEDLAKAFAELKAQVEAMGSPNTPPVRDHGEEEKEGKFLPAAFLNGITHLAKFGNFADACGYELTESGPQTL